MDLETKTETEVGSLPSPLVFYHAIETAQRKVSPAIDNGSELRACAPGGPTTAAAAPPLPVAASSCTSARQCPTARSTAAEGGAARDGGAQVLPLIAN